VKKTKKIKRLIAAQLLRECFHTMLATQHILNRIVARNDHFYDCYGDGLDDEEVQLIQNYIKVQSTMMSGCLKLANRMYKGCGVPPESLQQLREFKR